MMQQAIDDEIARYHVALEGGATSWDQYNTHVGYVRGLRWAEGQIKTTRKAVEKGEG